MNRGKQQYQATISKTELWKDHHYPPACHLLSFSHLSALWKAGCHVVSCPANRPTWQRTEGHLGPTAQKKLRFGPRYCKELNPAKSFMNDSEADLPLVKPSDEITAPETADLQPPRRPWATGTQISCIQISNSQKLGW